MIDLADLEAKALAATQGEWEAGDGWVFVPPADGNPSAALRDILRDVPEAQANAAFIEAAQPSVVLELIERIRAAEAKAGEPVAWATEGHLRDGSAVLRLPFLTQKNDAERYQRSNPEVTLRPLYAAPVDTATLAERVKTLEEALRPFAEMVREVPEGFADDMDVTVLVPHRMDDDTVKKIGAASAYAELVLALDSVNVGHLRRARKALGGSNE